MMPYIVLFHRTVKQYAVAYWLLARVRKKRVLDTIPEEQEKVRSMMRCQSDWFSKVKINKA